MKNVNITLSYYLSIFISLGICFLMFNGCSDDDATGPQSDQVSSINIHPETATITEDEQIDFSVVLLSATGDTLGPDDFDIEWQWWSTDPDVFTVEAGGLATGQNPGDAFCVVEATVHVAQHVTDVPDQLIVQAGFSSDGENRFQTTNLVLSAGNVDIAAMENISMNNMLRFTGRDSALVMVF
jgi:hypothetical protein